MADVTNGLGFDPNESSGVPKAPAGTRYVGLCKECRDFVELGPTFGCLAAGHGKDDIRVALLIDEHEEKPHLPAINIGALFMPALWGPAHGQWYMILFYPLWLVLDNLIYGSIQGSGLWPLALVAGIACAAFTVYYAQRANMFGYLRVAQTKTPEEYLRGERRWMPVLVGLALAMIAFASWYNIAVRPGLA